MTHPEGQRLMRSLSPDLLQCRIRSALLTPLFQDCLSISMVSTRGSNLRVVPIFSDLLDLLIYFVDGDARAHCSYSVHQIIRIRHKEHERK